jgi:3',5'-cyclic AMP phosphodiesterase CpdA
MLQVEFTQTNRQTMLTLLHISDLHFGPPYLPDVGDALIALAATLQPDIVVASGDFTQRAKRQQYADARTYLDRLPPVPTVVVPGNHDVPLYRVFERLFTPYALYRQYISAELESILVRQDVVIVALNTTSPLTAITGGRVTRAQLEFCQRAFAHAPASAARIVVAHHHFAPAPDYDDEHDVMRGARRALDAFSGFKVDLILGGHLHRGYIGNTLDIYPGLDRRHGAVVVQCGTSTSARGRAREREKNSFNLIRLDEKAINIEHFMYFRDLATFAPVSRHEFARRPSEHLDGKS